MCLGSRHVLCDFLNILGLAKAKTHSVEFFFPLRFYARVYSEEMWSI